MTEIEPQGDGETLEDRVNNSEEEVKDDELLDDVEKVDLADVYPSEESSDEPEEEFPEPD